MIIPAYQCLDYIKSYDWLLLQWRLQKYLFSVFAEKTIPYGEDYKNGYKQTLKQMQD